MIALNILKYLAEVIVALYVLCAIVNTLFGAVYLCVTLRINYVRRREQLMRQLTLHRLRTLVSKCLVKYAPEQP